MDLNEERKILTAERKRLQHYEKYHSDEERRRYHIEYELRRRQDPAYRARRSALQVASNNRKKELKKQLAAANVLVNVN
jgi:hypothetical protein